MGTSSTVQDLTALHSALRNGLISDANLQRVYSAGIDNPWSSTTGYGMETALTSWNTRIHRFLSGWTGNSVELMYDPQNDMTIALMMDGRVDWEAPRHDAIARIAIGVDRDAAMRQLVRRVRDW